MSDFPNNLIKDNSIHQFSSDVQLNQQTVPFAVDNNCMGPLDDPLYLLQNAQCFKNISVSFKTQKKQKSKKNDQFQITTQFLYGAFMPPYYSVLKYNLMEKFMNHIKNPFNPTKLFEIHKDLIEHEQELFARWISTIWEENLKNRRLNIIPCVEDYFKDACNFLNGYIKTHYNGMYRSKMTINYNKEDETINKYSMTHVQRIKSAQTKYIINLPKIDIKDVESKISFLNGEYNPPQKLPFVKDEICQTLSKDSCTDINICLSSIKHIMNLEKPNSVWLIPVNIKIDSENCKKTYIGGALSMGHFSQQQKSWYYLRKQLKHFCRKTFPETVTSETIQNDNEYNYDKWILETSGISDDVKKSFNLLIRNKPHFQAKNKQNIKERPEKLFMPKIEYQPEFGFEKITEEQLVEYWLDTYFRTPKSKLILVSVQHNMDIMMVKQKNFDSINLENEKQMYFQRLYLTLDKLDQLDAGEYVMLHNPKKPFQVELYQSSQYGGFNLLNMYFVLQQSEVSDSLIWNPIDAQVVCPIHEHFKVAPCMFRPNPNLLDIQMINEKVTRFRTNLEMKEKNEKEYLARRKRIKREKIKIKKKLERENDNLFEMKCNALNK